MKRNELVELHYITAIDNVESILEVGIVSHVRSKKVKHRSLAKQFVQDLRKTVTVPGGRRLHEYANLYIHARNPTLFKMIHDVGHEEIAVFRVSPDVLDLPKVVVTDQNAAALKYCRYAAAPDGLEIVDKEMVFAESWVHDHPAAQARHKSVKCAEVLVPDVVETEFLIGVYASCAKSESRLSEIDSDLDCTVDSHLYFLGARQ